jgi:hypothetical protein
VAPPNVQKNQVRVHQDRFAVLQTLPKLEHPKCPFGRVMANLIVGKLKIVGFSGLEATSRGQVKVSVTVSIEPELRHIISYTTYLYHIPLGNYELFKIFRFLAILTPKE